MTFVQMRTVPGLFVGRREIIRCVPADGDGAAYRCGACDRLMTPDGDQELAHVVLKCECGELNQL